MDDGLFEQITEATGLPKELVSRELSEILDRAGLGQNELTLETLREAMTAYLQDVILQAKDQP